MGQLLIDLFVGSRRALLPAPSGGGVFATSQLTAPSGGGVFATSQLTAPSGGGVFATFQLTDLGAKAKAIL